MRIACLLVFLPIIGFTQPKASGQELPAAIKPLTIGDTVPDVVLENIINYPSSSARLSNFKGKLLILDFFATWCAACAKGIPKLDSISRAYKGAVQVILVNPRGTRDTQKKIEARIKDWKDALTGFSIPVVIDDTLLFALFPHRELPHYVWINDQMRVVGITTSSSVTDAHINDVIAGKDVVLPVKSEDMQYNWEKPLFINGNGGNGEQVVYRALISRYVPGIGSTKASDYAGQQKYKRLALTNKTVLQLFKQAYRITFPDHRIIVNVSDTTKISAVNPSKTWTEQNSWCYELITPATPESVAYKRMQNDLEAFFHYKAYIESRLTNVWVLHSTNLASKSLSKEPDTGYSFSHTSEGNYIRNKPLAFLVNYLNRELPVAVIDESGIKEKLTLRLTSHIYSIDEWNKKLRPQGFYFTVEKRPVEYFIIQDK